MTVSNDDLESLVTENQVDATPISETVTEATYSVDQVVALSKNDLNFLAALAMPTVFEFAFPPIHLAIWNLLTTKSQLTRDFSKLAVGIPRGHAKSTLLKLFILWTILFTNKKFILITAATATLAQNILSDVMDMLEEPNIKKVFGDWKLGEETDRTDLKKFGFRGRNIILAALGAGSSLRGLNLKNERPDLILMDDVQKKEEVDSEEVSKKLEQWIVGTLMKTKSPRGCLFIFLGNMYPSPNCILKKLKDNPTWISFIVGAILADGKALWEDLYPLKQLLEELENDTAMGHPEIFFSEVLNDPDASVNNNFNLEAIPVNPFEQDNLPQGRFIIIDPSGSKKKSDDTTIGLFSVYDSCPVFSKLIVGKLSPLETIHQALTMALTEGATVIGVESVAYQSSLLFWFDQVCQQRGITGIHLVEVFTGGIAKNRRILESFKSLLASEWYLSSSVRSTYVYQASQFKPLKTDNKDDILDLGAYCLQVLQTYGHLIALIGIIKDGDFESSSVLSISENCDF